jgi:hypothetical protein
MTEAAAPASTATSAPAAPPPAPASSASPPPQQSAPPAGVISDAAYDQLPTDADRERFARVSRGGNDRGSQWQERSTLPSETTATTGQPGEQPNAALNPTEMYKLGDVELSGQKWLDLIKFKGEQELRATQVPAEASQYSLPDKLPADALPPGFDFRFDANDPALAAAKNWAHANGLSQDQFTSLMTNYGAMEAKKQAVYAGAQRAELAKLGDRATMRVTALDTFFTGLLGAEAAKHIRGGMYSAGIVESLEKMASKFQSQNAASFRQDGREPNSSGPGRVSEEAYNAMSPGEKYSYSKSFDQKQFR